MVFDAHWLLCTFRACLHQVIGLTQNKPLQIPDFFRSKIQFHKNSITAFVQIATLPDRLLLAIQICTRILSASKDSLPTAIAGHAWQEPALTVSRLEIEFLSPGFRHQPRHCDPGKLCNLDGRWIQSVHRSRANRFVSAGLGPLEPSQPRCRLRRLLTRLYLSPDSEGKSSGPSRPFRSGRPLLDLGLFEAFSAADVCCFTS